MSGGRDRIWKGFGLYTAQKVLGGDVVGNTQPQTVMPPLEGRCYKGIKDILQPVRCNTDTEILHPQGKPLLGIHATRHRDQT